MTTYPACFPSYRHYTEWRHCARVAREQCTPCDDCSPAYSEQQIARQKCMRAHVEEHFLVPGKIPSDGETKSKTVLIVDGTQPPYQENTDEPSTT